MKASIVTTNRRAPGGQFVLHAKALPGNPYDGHTLRDVIEDTQKLTGCEIERAYVDKGYRGHDAQNPRRVFISGQKRGVFGAIKRELRRRSAIEPVIGHMKAEGHLGRCYLKGRAGDAANTILTAVGYNFRRILAWLRTSLAPNPDRNIARLHHPISAQSGLLTDDSLRANLIYDRHNRHRTTCPWWPPPSILQNLIFNTHNDAMPRYTIANAIPSSVQTEMPTRAPIGQHVIASGPGNRISNRPRTESAHSTYKSTCPPWYTCATTVPLLAQSSLASVTWSCSGRTNRSTGADAATPSNGLDGTFIRAAPNATTACCSVDTVKPAAQHICIADERCNEALAGSAVDFLRGYRVGEYAPRT